MITLIAIISLFISLFLIMGLIYFSYKYNYDDALEEEIISPNNHWAYYNYPRALERVFF